MKTTKWDNVLSQLGRFSFQPRTLEINIPNKLFGEILSFRAFMQLQYDKTGFTIYDFTNDEWPNDKRVVNYFWNLPQEERTKILVCITSFIHELTHKIDFLTSPFGLQFYVNTIREYSILQEFFPQILDNKRTVNKLRFLASFSEKLSENDLDFKVLNQYWGELGEIINFFYAMGDASTIPVLSKYIKDGWSKDIKGSLDLYNRGYPLKLVTVSNFFHTFQAPNTKKFWYLRPVSIFEAKAITNSILFIFHLLGESGINEAIFYFEKIYIKREDSKKPKEDYLFILNYVSIILGFDSFYQALKSKDFKKIKHILYTTSSACWYALQAPPHLKDENYLVGNPITRLYVAIRGIADVTFGKTKGNFESISDILNQIDDTEIAKSYRIKPLNNIIPDCIKIIDYFAQYNEKNIWNPEVKNHFNHILKIMRPHFENREITYSSLLSTPNSGNPLIGCQNDYDFELTYDDYHCPQAVKDWFGIRSNFLFKLNKPTEELLVALDQHFLAFYCPYNCECGQGITNQWLSRHKEIYILNCGFCNKTKTIDRDDFKTIHA